MFLTTILLTLFVSSLSKSKPHYVFPEPVIEPFKPQGFQVTLPHTPADQIFAFHGNINRPISENEVGDLAQQVSKRVKGQWRVYFPDVRLRPGDKVYYWLFVHNGAMGYKCDSRVYEVTNFISQEPFERPRETTPRESATVCEEALVTLTHALLESQKQAASLRETVDILRNILERDSNSSRTLNIEGLRVPEGDLKSTLEALIFEKLLLGSVSVEAVSRTGDGKVQFRVRNVDEKLQIIKAAKTKLQYSRYNITY